MVLSVTIRQWTKPRRNTRNIKQNAKQCGAGLLGQYKATGAEGQKQ